MRLQLARRQDKKWAVFDEAEQCFRLDGATTEEVIVWFLQHTRRILQLWLTDPPPQMSYKEMRLRAGLIRCSICDRVLVLEEYKVELSEERQKCKKC